MARDKKMRPLNVEEQCKRFVSAAQEVGFDEDELHFDEAVKIARKPPPGKLAELNNRSRRNPASEPGF